jgi:hypothetical protein
MNTPIKLDLTREHAKALISFAQFAVDELQQLSHGREQCQAAQQAIDTLHAQIGQTEEQQ